MRYIAITYNYLTLSKAIIYAKKIWKFEKTRILFLSRVSNIIPPKRFNEFNIDCVNPQRPCFFPTFLSEERVELLQAKAIVTHIEKKLKISSMEECTLVVFKDQRVRECNIINAIKTKFPKIKFLLMEEGLGLYASPEQISFSIKRIIGCAIKLALGVTRYYVENHPMGYNPAIDRIICVHPDVLEKRGFSKHAVLEKECDVFSCENCDYLLKNFFKINFNEHFFDFVFLTQPIYPKSKIADEKYDKFLNELFSILTLKGSVLIKKHPRDKWDYSSLKNINIEISESNVSCIPFECIMGIYGRPQMLTLFSSAALNSLPNKKSIFLYKLLPDSLDGSQIDEVMIKVSNSVICKSFSDLSALLNV